MTNPKPERAAQPQSRGEHTPLGQMLDAYDECRADRDRLLAACKKARTCASLPDAVKDLLRAAIQKAEETK